MCVVVVVVEQYDEWCFELFGGMYGQDLYGVKFFVGNFGINGVWCFCVVLYVFVRVFVFVILVDGVQFGYEFWQVWIVVVIQIECEF